MPLLDSETSLLKKAKKKLDTMMKSLSSTFENPHEEKYSAISQYCSLVEITSLIKTLVYYKFNK